MIRYKVHLMDRDMAIYTDVYVTLQLHEAGISFSYQTGTAVFYPWSAIKFIKKEVIDDDEETCED